MKATRKRKAVTPLLSRGDVVKFVGYKERLPDDWPPIFKAGDMLVVLEVGYCSHDGIAAVRADSAETQDTVFPEEITFIRQACRVESDPAKLYDIPSSIVSDGLGI